VLGPREQLGGAAWVFSFPRAGARPRVLFQAQDRSLHHLCTSKIGQPEDLRVPSRKVYKKPPESHQPWLSLLTGAGVCL
jgi:hypothetical protein